MAALKPTDARQVALNSLGACRSCYPEFFRCDPASGIRCCGDSRFSCRSGYCTPDSPTANKFTFASWGKTNDSEIFSAVNTSFAPAYVHSGDVSLKLQGDATHFVFSTATPALQGGHPYFLEFWTTTSQGAGSGVGYAVFDSANNAYFNPDSGWTYIESVSSNDPVTDRGVIDTMLKGDSDPPAYVHYITYFTALPNAKIELRFYPPSSGAGYVDDVSIVEAKDFSLSFWVKANGSEAGSSLVNKMGTEAGADQGISIGFPSPLQLNASFASAHQLAGADCMNTPATFDECKIWLPADLSDANWHLVSIVAQRLGNATVYVDGARQATHTFRLGRLNNSVGHRLGYTGTANSFSGYLDEVRLHRRALSAAEASDAYRLRLQANCTATLTATYSGVPEGVPLSAAYNANLKIRNSFPSILLSMPFDADITTNQSGAVPDYSGFMRAGTLSGGISWTPDGRVGGAYSFDNDSSAISFPTPLLSGAADFTLSAWVKPNAAGPYYIMGNYGVGNPAGVRLLVDSGRPVLLIGSTALSSTLAAPAGQWTHVAATRSGGVAAIYVNSISGGTAPIPDPIGQDANFMIGSSPDILDVFGGEIDEVRVYERALSDSEIYSLYYDLPLLYNGTVPSHAGR
jgi:hypothetical protein